MLAFLKVVAVVIAVVVAVVIAVVQVGGAVGYLRLFFSFFLLLA